MKKIGIFSLLLVIASITSSCNTIRGVGEDVEGLGKSMQRNAEY